MGGKVKYHQLTEKQKKEYLGDFYTMVSMLKGKDDVKNFFKDLLTLSESVMISRRIQVAKLLMKGRTYEEIQDELNVGKATVQNVNKWLDEGFGGYRKIINEYEKAKKKKTKNKGKISPPFSFRHLRKKYPAHYFLFNLFMD